MAVEKVCSWCTQLFYIKRDRAEAGKGRWCSRTCQQAERASLRSEKSCEICNKPFTSTPGREKQSVARFCSRECSKVGLTTSEVREITCGHCATVFKTKADHGVWPKYCSLACRNDRKKGNFDPVESKRLFLEDFNAPSAIAKQMGVSNLFMFNYLKEQIPNFDEHYAQCSEEFYRKRAEIFFLTLYEHPEWSMHQASRELNFGGGLGGNVTKYLKEWIEPIYIEVLIESRKAEKHARASAFILQAENQEASRKGLRIRTNKHTGQTYFEDLTEEQRALLVFLFQKEVVPIYRIAELWRKQFDCYVAINTITVWLKRLLTPEEYAEGVARIVANKNKSRRGSMATTAIYRPGVMDNPKRKGPVSKHRAHWRNFQREPQ